MIGWFCISVFPYYDKLTAENKFKKRPMLVIGMSDSDEYVVLPISKVSDSRRISPEYDIKLNPDGYPELGLTTISYLKTHKQTIMHSSQIKRRICNLK